MSGFFKQVPREIEEAASVDGCSRLGAAIRVVLPVSVPGLLSLVIFAFTLSMQEFIYALTFVSTSAEKPVTLGITTDLVRGDVYFWGSLMARGADGRGAGGDSLQLLPRPFRGGDHRRSDQVGPKFREGSGGFDGTIRCCDMAQP